jgi:hypothetical protein
MTNTFATGAIAIALGLATAAAATAQTAAPPAPAAVQGPSVDWSWGKLMADPTSKAVLARDLPMIVGYENQDQLASMTVRQIANFPQAGIDATKLAAVQADLTAAATGAPAH